MALVDVCYDVYENAFGLDRTVEELVPVKTKFYEKNLSWIKAKEALDDFLKKNPELNTLDFNDYYYRTYSSEETEW